MKANRPADALNGPTAGFCDLSVLLSHFVRRQPPNIARAPTGLGKFDRGALPAFGGGHRFEPNRTRQDEVP